MAQAVAVAVGQDRDQEAVRQELVPLVAPMAAALVVAVVTALAANLAARVVLAALA